VFVTSYASSKKHLSMSVLWFHGQRKNCLCMADILKASVFLFNKHPSKWLSCVINVILFTLDDRLIIFVVTVS